MRKFIFIFLCIELGYYSSRILANAGLVEISENLILKGYVLKKTVNILKIGAVDKFRNCYRVINFKYLFSITKW